jgi:hypothetical protein
LQFPLSYVRQAGAIIGYCYGKDGSCSHSSHLTNFQSPQSQDQLAEVSTGGVKNVGRPY